MTCPRLPPQHVAALESQAPLFSLTRAVLPARPPEARSALLGIRASIMSCADMLGGLGVLLGRASGMRVEGVPLRVCQGGLAWSFSASFPGSSPQHLCPQGPSACRKQCQRDHYLDRANRCTACVSCRGKSRPPLHGSFQRSRGRGSGGPFGERQNLEGGEHRDLVTAL